MPTETLMIKDSKIDWIGYIPQEWNVKKIKYCAYLKTGTTPDGNDGIVDEDSDYNWYTPGDFVDNYILQLSERNILKNAVKKYHIKLYSPGSVLMVCIGATVGKIGYIDKYAYSNQQITALMPKKNIIGKFLLYLLSAMTKYMNENAQYTTLPIINNTYLSSINIVLPNRIEEQQAIADFLDEKCEKIDKVIGEIEEQIQVLEDYKKSLITETVTKGLDKNVPMKNSGIDWIGQIPKDWNIKRIKYFTNLNGRIGWQGLTTEDYQDEGPFLITGVDFLNGSIDWSSCTHITEKRWIEANTIQIRNGDLLITKDGTVGKVAVVSGLNDKASLNSGVLFIRPQGNVEYYNRYIYYQLISDVFWSWFEFNKSGNSTIIHLYQQDFANLYTLLPNITEQKQIADYLDKECEKIDKTIKNKKEQLETIKEYKKSLIYEYVTGKKRVAC